MKTVIFKDLHFIIISQKYCVYVFIILINIDNLEIPFQILILQGK